MLVFALPIALGFGTFPSPADPAVPARTSYSGAVVERPPDAIHPNIGLPADGDWPSTKFTATAEGCLGRTRTTPPALGTGAYDAAVAHWEHDHA